MRESLGISIAARGTAMEEFSLPYLLGHKPMEQYLAPFPDGRLQPLPVGFDTTRREWFDIFCDDPREPGDWGYWASRGMTANAQCLYCHTTGYAKGYIAARDAYESGWAEMGVGCEACHGPGQHHAAARSQPGQTRDDYNPVARRDGLLDLCATCHARRREIASGFTPGDHFLDFFEPILLDGSEYYADGQIEAEDYEWASFLQSRMAQHGVTCLDCHDAHSAQLKTGGNQLCLRCHDAQLAKPTHLHHKPDSEGAQCVACHMPETTYMARDRRRDHSLSLPDPQATVELGIPNACGRCHAEQGAAWAEKMVREWYGTGPKRAARREGARLLAQARRGAAETADGLLTCVHDCDSVIRRASAARLLARFADRPDVRHGLVAAASADEALVRWSAVRALAESGVTNPPIGETLRRAAVDPIRTVRLEAAWALRRVDLASLGAADRTVVESAFAEWEASAELQAEYPESEQSRGVFYAARGDVHRAEAAYRRALQLTPEAVPPRYNLALLLVEQGRISEAEAELVTVRERDSEFAPAAYALGLIYGNSERWREATLVLQACVKADPSYPGALHDLAYAYVHLGQGDVAMSVLQAAAGHAATRPEALRTLISVSLELQDREAAKYWARVATTEDPALAADGRVQEILRE